MKKIMMVCLLVLGIAATGHARDAVVETAPAQSFETGGTPIVIPSPAAEMSEMGYDNRALMEIFVPVNNRLIAAFAPTKDLPGLTKRADDLTLTKYAMVEVPRRSEYADIGAADFRKVAAGVRKQFGETMHASTKEAQEEFRRRLDSLDLDEVTVDIGKPLQLGTFFSRPDAYGFGMIVPVSTGDRKVKMGMGVALIRVKRRLLFVYLYAAYKGKDTVLWLREKTEGWAAAILKANA